MNIPQIKKIDRSEWLKLLHVGEDLQEWLRLSREGGSPEQQLARQMDKAEQQLLGAAQPRGIYRIVERAQIHAEGFSIARHLEGCDQVAVLSVTSGSGIDELIRRTQISDISMAVVLDTGASVLAEQIADTAEETIRRELGAQDGAPARRELGAQDGTTARRELEEQDGAPARRELEEQDGAPAESGSAKKLWMTSRFSPGYGDFPLDYQRELLALTDAPRKIGLMVTSGSIMVPRKSITALIGIADHPVTGRLASCDECLLRSDCPFLKEGQHC